MLSSVGQMGKCRVEVGSLMKVTLSWQQQKNHVAWEDARSLLSEY